MIHRLLLAGASALAIATAAPAFAEEGVRTFDIPAQPLSSALLAYSRTTDTPVIASMDLLAGKTAPAIQGDMPEGQALAMLLQGTGLKAERGATGSIVVERIASDPQSGSAAGDGAEGTVAALIVTAQKREQDIQDVPIAISAFTQKDLEAQKIEGGFDLLKAIPNVTFSKNNFSSYNFAIRGIGTKAVSVTTDPGVAVEFNSSALIRNRLFEQEYFDIERVEVLRGPQGTLHGRNATAGVINVISAKPTGEWGAQLKLETGNYETKRLSGYLNAPLVGDKLAVRIAGAWTSRQGYDYNATTQHHINGRDLYSVRTTIGFKPVESFRSTLIWEHFNEDDDRSRTGKQICTRDPGPESVGSSGPLQELTRAAMSQGCKDVSLYDPAAFGTPNGLSIPFIWAAAQLGPNSLGQIGVDHSTGEGVFVPLVYGDPYGGLTQSTDLRTIASIKDPKYRAKADIFELNFDWDLTPNLTLTSQSAYDKDQIYSTQDYNRFNTVAVFNSSDGLNVPGYPDLPSTITPGGVFCDPQLGCSSSIAGFDISAAKSTQFTQEVRIQSNFPGPVNFSAGGNYTRYRTVEDYYVLFNVLTALAESPSFLLGNFSPDPALCGKVNAYHPVPIGSHGSEGCIYIDTNPLESINGEGHNYFRSKNPYTLKSAAAFGELYWQARDNLKVTAGVRYTDDHKTFTPVPSQVLLSSDQFLAGTVDRGYPELPELKQHWGELTGRLGLEWRPEVSFTDQTMVYAFYSHGYKGGGANPPGVGFDPRTINDRFFGGGYDCEADPESPICKPFAAVLPYPATFEPEFINAYEVGSKNTLLGGSLVLNGDVFFYDYKNYQVSQIKSRTAVNENFNAKVWGAELESVWQPTRRLRFNLALGYQDSMIGNGELSIDLMDRLQGHTDYTIMKPFPQLPDNCVVLKSVAEQYVEYGRADGLEAEILPAICPGSYLNLVRPIPIPSSAFPNQGLGFYADVSGNHLPNAPHWTQSLGAQYTIPMGDWDLRIRADFYHQSQSWARVYEDPIDKLHGWKNANIVFTLTHPEKGWEIETYVKNLFDDNAITDTFLNSDDTALTTNIFTLDPRLIGLSLRKTF